MLGTEYCDGSRLWSCEGGNMESAQLGFAMTTEIQDVCRAETGEQY